MSDLKKKLSKIITVALAAVTVSSTGVMGAGAAYSIYGSSTTAYSSKSGYNFYKYGTGGASYTAISRTAGKDRFVIPQVIILKKGNGGDYTSVENSVSNAGVVQKGYKRTVYISQSNNYRRYWHRGVLKEDTLYSSNAYHVFSYNTKF